MVFVAGANLENAGSPVIRRPLIRLRLLALGVGERLLPRDALIIGDIYVVFSKVFDGVDW